MKGQMGPFTKSRAVGLPKRKKNKLTRRISAPKSLNLGSLGKGKL